VSISAAQAREYLEKQGYAPPDAQGGKAMLSYMLLLLLHCTPPNIIPKGIRAVTKLLESKEAGQTTDKIVATVMQKLDLMIEHMSRKANLAEAAISDTRLAVDQLYRTGEEMRDELQHGMEAAKEEIQKIMESFHNDINKLTEVAARPTNSNICRGTEQLITSIAPQHPHQVQDQRETGTNRHRSIHRAQPYQRAH